MIAIIVGRDIKNGGGHLNKRRWLITIILAIIALLIGGIAYAAWSQTKQVQTQAFVLGTFSLDTLTCNSQIPGEIGTCEANLMNNYDQVITVSDVVLTTDRADVVSLNNWRVDFEGGEGMPHDVNPGQAIVILVDYKPAADAALGVINFDLSVTANGP